ncbi:C40 family peptidase [Dactylosporangium salmoneum]|uniref:NlpC/P60 domain-containing protein n=1 Tax=Dactylosporangium salmoneum TaxID=53361 RepID=A0ABP5UF59_9ACTN
MTVIGVPLADLWRTPAGDERVTQALLGEEVVVEEARPDGWARVILPAQPAPSLDPRGYPGWLRAADLRPATPAEALALARRLMGVPYLWGGLSDAGIDCSGLVHLAWRRLGVPVPRDADDQAAAATAVPPGEERPGDLYFFARPGRRVHHVGIVAGPPPAPGDLAPMLHACGDAGRVVEELPKPDRVDTFAGAARLPI